MNALIPILKPSGSVAIVIRSHVSKGAVSPYILHTRIALQEAGWCEPEELLWIKPDAAPTAPNQRPRRSWEHILWFARQDNIKALYCDPKANGNPDGQLGSLASNRYLKIYDDTKERSRTDKTGQSRSRDIVSVPVSKNHRSTYNSHPAQYPVPLAQWIIRLLVPPNGLVLDPFGGSGSTSVAAYLEGRDSMMMDTNEEYVSIARRRLHEVENQFPQAEII